MTLAYRRAPRIGLQWIPPFSKTATLHQLAQCWDIYAEIAGGDPFPEANSIYNIACLAMFSRNRIISPAVAEGSFGCLSRSYWSTQIGQGVRCIFGETKIAVPQGAELISVSWMKPPDWVASGGSQGPFPEDLFRLQYGLAL
jgi:hypothetical protein